MRRLWQRGKFHLSALMLLVPLPFLPNYFSPKPIFAPPEIRRDLTAGAFPLRLVTYDEAPHWGGNGERMKEYRIHLRPADIDRVRGVFLRVGKPRNLRAAGALGFGNPYEREAEVAVPAEPAGTEELWVTVEDWNGQVHQASTPLAGFLGGK
ncbi:hypothetical protein VY88_21945 [Azospirillum thiophilum]|uniref:Uncharacterized protein n=1 Tax=Azospirillum thiophilum TaxID=528244 RepID=A0AAC8ZVI3_9PROT|nr:hypothetical protein [Azospirillum thiophilum]ALG73507.1 hypothetical protein AL072_21120 [Azospirillum thiophilum]KJR62896.1 hypothetical protein VY88_21945 [Azospirillum thiophilum]